MYRHLIETRLDFAAFVRACELQEGCKGLNLRAYLIMVSWVTGK
jgi:hypothetical protein